MSEPRFLKAGIIIPVGDIHGTIEWYERVLGFETRYIHGEGRRGENENFANYAIMHRDEVGVSFIMDEGGPVWTRAGTGYLNLNVEGVDTLHAQVQSKGVPIVRELQQENWPARGFTINDPSGNEVHIEESN